MNEEVEQVFAIRKGAQSVVDAAQKSIEALNAAIQQQQQITAEVKSFTAKSLVQIKQGAQQGVQEAIQQAAKIDIGEQIKTAVQPTLDSIRLAARSLNEAAESADRANSRLSGHRLIWKEIALCFIMGFIIGGAAVWILVKQRIEGINQRLDNLSAVSQQQTDTRPAGNSQKPGSGHKGSKPASVQTPQPGADAEPQ